MSRRRSRTGGRTLVEFRFMIHAVQLEHLLSISADLKRRNDKEIVNRAAVVFLMAVWQTHAEAVAQDAVEKIAGQPGSPVRLSTPNSKKVDDLFEKAVGLKNVSQYWRWRGMTAARARTRLNKILELRHEIAHKGRTKARLQKAQQAHPRDVRGRTRVMGGVESDAFRQALRAGRCTRSFTSLRRQGAPGSARLAANVTEA